MLFFFPSSGFGQSLTAGAEVANTLAEEAPRVEAATLVSRTYRTPASAANGILDMLR